MNPAILAAFPFIADMASRGVSGKGLSENVIGMMNGGSGGASGAESMMPDAATVPMGQVQQQELPAPEQAPMYDAAMSPEMKRQFAVQQMQQRGVPMTTTNLDMMLQHLSSQAPQNTEQSILANVPGIDIPANAYGSVANEIAAEQQAPKGGANQVTMKPGEAKNMPLPTAQSSTVPAATPAAAPQGGSMMTPQVANVVKVGEEPFQLKDLINKSGTDKIKSAITSPAKQAPVHTIQPQGTVTSDMMNQFTDVGPKPIRGEFTAKDLINKSGTDKIKQGMEVSDAQKASIGEATKGSLKVRTMIQSIKEMKPKDQQSALTRLQNQDPNTYRRVMEGLNL